MKPVDNQVLVNQLKWRYATQKFDPTRKIPSQDWDTLEQALIATASSFGLQPWHFIVVTSQKLKEQLRSASRGQAQLTDASHVVVFTIRKNLGAGHVQKHLHRISEVRGVPVERLEGFKGAMLGAIAQMDSAALESWSAHQAYIALGTLLTSAALLGIDACPMEGIDRTQYDQILGLGKHGLGTLVIATLGYRASDDPAARHPKVRFRAEDVVTHID